MSYSALLASAAATAQIVLAPMSDPTSGGVFTIGAASYTGVLNLRKIEMGVTPNGLERIEQLDIAATTAQWTTAPVAAPRFRLTAYSRQWWCTSVDAVGAHYLMTCVPA